MNRGQLIRAVAAHTGQDPKETERAVRGLTEVITSVVARGEPVTIQGFAKFAKSSRAARMGRNPRTGESIRIPARTRVRVSAMKTLKDTVMGPASKAPRLASGVWPTSPDLLSRQAAERQAADGHVSASGVQATKTAATKRSAKKTTAKKTAAKKAPVTKRAATKTTAKKTAAKKAPVRRDRR